MRFDHFVLDHWLQEKAGPHIRFDFGSSTGPIWPLRDVLALEGGDVVDRLLDISLRYEKPAGGDTLRSTLAAMAGVSSEEVIVLTGASEALTHVFLAAATPGANAIVPFPCYPPQEAIPRALGLETRSYHLRKEDSFAINVDEICSLINEHTKLLLVNVPHNPTGASISNKTMRVLHDLAVERGIQFVCDEVHSPVFHGPSTRSAACLEQATVIGDMSKAFSMPGLRLGWIIERTASRRADYLNTREHVTLSNSILSEFVAEIAVRNHRSIHDKTVHTATANLVQLDGMFSRIQDLVGWVRPAAVMTGFPWLKLSDDSRAFCSTAADRGLLLVPGDCMGAPEHFRVGFGNQAENFEDACTALESFILSWFHNELVIDQREPSLLLQTPENA